MYCVQLRKYNSFELSPGFWQRDLVDFLQCALHVGVRQRIPKLIFHTMVGLSSYCVAFYPKMVKITLVQKYVMNHSQYILYSIDSVNSFSPLNLVMCINLGLQELFFIIFWPHKYAHKLKVSIILGFFCDMNNISGDRTLIHIFMLTNWSQKDVMVLMIAVCI